MGSVSFSPTASTSAVRASDFSPDGYTQTLVGEGLFEFGDRDGKALQARLQHCLGVAYHAGKVYIADTYNNKIKVLDMAAKEVTTVLGTGEREILDEPGGLSLWAWGDEVRLHRGYEQSPHYRGYRKHGWHAELDSSLAAQLTEVIADGRRE